MGNILEPLVDSLIDTVKLLPKLWDMWGNLVYRVVEGKSFEDMKGADELVIDNIEKYRYEPLVDNEKELFKVFKFENKIVYQYEEGDKKKLMACIGVDGNGNNVWFDMLNSHLLIGGMARQGKSSVIRSILIGLMLNYTPNEVRFVLCDFKRSDVKLFEKYKHTIGGCSNDKEMFLKQIEWLRKEAEKRAYVLNEYEHLNMIDLNNDESINIKFPYIIMVIDELPQVMADEKCQTELHLAMSRLTYAGIYFILATQDCSKNVIGRCKMNCPQTIGFRTRDETDSKLLMPTGELQNLRVQGRCKIDDMGEIREVQTFFTDVETVKSFLKDLKKEDDTNTQQ